MVKNDHFQLMKQFSDLENNLLGQSFTSQDALNQLEEQKNIAQMYALHENSIAVLSDLRSNRSYIYNGALAKALGLSENGINKEIESIWEDEIYARVHPDDLAARHLLELHFFHLLRKVPITQRSNFRTYSVIRMRNNGNEYIPVLHRTFYQLSSSNGSLWLALCLYNFATDIDNRQGFCSIIQNTATGEIIRSNSESTENILSSRERQVLSLIEQGLASKEIATRLSISKNTIDRHRQNIMEKLRVNNSIEALKVAKALKIIY